jgi:hypothetical protein
MIKVPILTYTHSDYEDVCKLQLHQLQKYLPNQEVIFASNKPLKFESDYYSSIYYDDSKKYTDRLKEILTQVGDRIILFQHEDMILYNQVNVDIVNKYVDYVNNGLANGIKMNYIKSDDIVSSFDDTLISNSYSKFSVQPTIIKSSTLLDLIDTMESLDIWEFEKNVPIIDNMYVAKYGNVRKRGILHYDSLVYPYIATAINKGKWNMSEYTKELDSLFLEHGINPFERGIV